MAAKVQISRSFPGRSGIVLFPGDCLDLLADIPDATIQLAVTSPPYNLGKEYETKLQLDAYLEQQARVVRECVRVLAPGGSLCWQTGNYVDRGAIVPLDTILYPVFRDAGLLMRNRIVWHFEHGLHCSRRFSGRYETIAWYTKTNQYTFNLDPVRVPQKYPGKKHFKGPRAGEFSCNPLGKNPGDLWTIPNVKHNHVEKTAHPCQFPVELIQRLVLALTNPGDWVLDPFAGTGTSLIASIRHARHAAGAETHPPYLTIARARIRQEIAGTLPTRPMNRPVFDPKDAGKNLTSIPGRK